MVVTFNEDYLEKLYSKGETGTKKIWFQPQIVRGYQKGIKYLITLEESDEEYVVTICNIMDLSNHYK